MAQSGQRGFTLFEVMAAVLVMGLIYTLLASTAAEGQRAEGISRRRLEASLLADRALYDLEAQLLLGSLPELGSSEEEVGDFRVTVEVLPFDPTPFLPQPTEEPEVDAVSLFDPPATGEPGVLRSLEVAVSWTEGFDEYAVRRQTFAYDVAAVAALVPTSEGAGGGAGTGAGPGGESPEGGDTTGARPASSAQSMDAQIQQMLETLRNAK